MSKVFVTLVCDSDILDELASYPMSRCDIRDVVEMPEEENENDRG